MLRRAIVLALLAVFVGSAVASTRRKSSTWDETHYYGIGKAILTGGGWQLPGSILHPPLAFYLSSVPLLFAETDERLFEADPDRVDDVLYRALNDHERGRAALSHPSNEGDGLLNRCRLMMVLLAVWMGAAVYAWSRDLYGPASGLLSLVFFSFGPNLLAHASLITPDIVLTTFWFLTSYHLWRCLRDGSSRHAALGGVCLGLALLSKHTAILLPPTCVLLWGLWRWRHGAVRWAHAAVFLGVGVLVFLLGYGFHLEPYVTGLQYQREHAGVGHRSFLFGEVSSTGWWYYFVVALLLKTPVATLILLGVSAVLAARTLFRPRALDEVFVLFPAFVVFAFFSLKHQSIGLRYVLPIFPFLFVFLGRAHRAMLSRWLLRVPGLALIAWMIVSSIRIHPHYLAYFNELSGGPEQAYRSLVDSNLDWGQDLKGLKRFMDEKGIDKVSLSFFGTDSPTRYGIEYEWLPSMHLERPQPEKPLDFTPDGWLAISVTNLQGVYFENRDIYRYLWELEPVAKIGYSIFLYDLRK